MSIFKRLSKKKPGENGDIQDNLVLDETISLVEEETMPAIPKNADDAIPSLSSLTLEENEIIQSILNDQKTPRTKPNSIENAADFAPLPPRSTKSIDDLLNDSSYRSALSVLKGETSLEETEMPLKEELPETAEENPTNLSVPSISEEPLATADAPQSIEESDETQQEIETERDVVMTSVQETPATPEEDSIMEATETYVSHVDIETPHHGGRRLTLTEMRSDVGQITSDIENGESLYRRAQQRVENLSRFIEKAEVDFSLLDRLEPENKALKSENLLLDSELNKGKDRISQLNASLEDIQRRFGDAKTELDTTHSKLAQRRTELEQSTRDIERLTARYQELQVKADRGRNDFDVESRENTNLRQKITEVTEQLDRATSAKLNNAKQVETLKIDLTDQTQNREKLRLEVTDLRHALDEAQRQNTLMRGEIGSVHEEIRSFKTQYEFNILKRDERVTDLEGQIIALNDQLRLKAEIIESTTRDISILRKERTSQDLERERLENTVKQQSYRLNTAEEEALTSRRAANELDQKYQDVTAALARASEQREIQAPAAIPDILPAPTPKFTPQAAPVVTAQLEAPTNPYQEQDEEEFQPAPSAERITRVPQIEDEIEGMLTDYKLGIRSSIG